MRVVSSAPERTYNIDTPRRVPHRCVVHQFDVFINLVCRFITLCIADPIWGVWRCSYVLQREADHKTWDCMILPRWDRSSRSSLHWQLLNTAPSFTGDCSHKYRVFKSQYSLGMVLILYGWMGSLISKSMVKRGEINVITWLLRSTSSY